MLDPTLITSLGVPGFALWILWMSYRGFMTRMKEKDREQEEEREKFAQRMDAKDERFSKLESDVRTNLATVLIENSNVLKQAVHYVARNRKPRR